MATYHCSVKHGSKGSGASGLAKSDYICREGAYSDKPDLEYKESGGMPEWAQAAPRAFWQAGDEYERANGRVYTEIEVALPREIAPERRRELAQAFIRDQLPGHPYTLAIHNPKAALDGGDQPHAHIIFSERKLDGIERSPELFFKRANAHEPEKGGTAKDRTWNEREKVQRIREAWEEQYNRYSPEPVSCRSLKEQGIDREPERRLGPKMARPEAPEAGKVLESRADVKKLAELTREMAALSGEIGLEQPPPVVCVTVGELLREARGYGDTLEERDRAYGEALRGVRRRKDGVARPYREEAIQRYVTQTYQPRREALAEKVHDYNSRLKAHQETGIFKKIGWDFGASYDRATAQLTRESAALTDEQRRLTEQEARTAAELSTPGNRSAAGSHDVERLAHQLARERDPDYRETLAAIERDEAKLSAARKASQPERTRISVLCRNLERLDGAKQLELTMPPDRIVKKPALVDKLNQGFEKYHRLMERDRGMER